MNFTEGFRTGIVGMGRGKADSSPSALLGVGMTNVVEGLGVGMTSGVTGNERQWGHEEKDGVDQGMQGTWGVGGTLFYGAGQGIGDGGVDALWGVWDL